VRRGTGAEATPEGRTGGPIAPGAPASRAGVVASLARGLSRARRNVPLALWLAAPSLLALPLLAAPIFLALADGLPADRDLLARLDGTAAVDLVNRAYPAHAAALAVAGLAGAALWGVGGFVLSAGAAGALARGRRRVTTTRLFATVGRGLGPILRLLVVAAALYGAVFCLARLVDGFLLVAGENARTDAAAHALEFARLALAAAALVVARCWCRLAVAVSAGERRRSALGSFLRAARLAFRAPALWAVDLAATLLGVAAAALASLPRWLLPQGNWGTVLLGLVLAQLPVVVRSFFRVAGTAATLDVLARRSAARRAAEKAP
jgi:hypothetical protein